MVPPFNDQGSFISLQGFWAGMVPILIFVQSVRSLVRHVSSAGQNSIIFAPKKEGSFRDIIINKISMNKIIHEICRNINYSILLSSTYIHNNFIIRYEI